MDNSTNIASKLFGYMTLTYAGGNVTAVTYANRQLFHILGIIGECTDYYSELSRFFDFATIAETIGNELADKDSYTTANVIDKDGELIYIQLEMNVDDRLGDYISVGVSVIDVTDTVKLVSRHSTVLSTVVSLSSDYIFEYSIKDDLLSISEKNGVDFVVTQQLNDFENQFINEKVVCDDDVEAFRSLCSSARLGKESCTAELRLYNDRLCDYAWYVVNTKTLFDDNGKPECVVGRALNINRSKDAEMTLIHKAERDPLTKIYNKATTISLIKDYLRSDSRETYDALIIVDVDNFKQINDNLGHLFGDSVLVDLSQEMQDLFRSSDVVGRIGGDEFLVFLRGVKQKSHIEDKASDICKIFDLLYCGEHEEKITGSLGISVFPQDGCTYEELFKKADIALYSSKNAGKNCFTFYSDDYASLDSEDGLAAVNQYRRDTPITQSREIFDAQITDFAFDIMNKTKDVSSAITMLLSKVGKHFGLSCVSVVETIEEPHCLKYTYQWCGKCTGSRLGKIVTFDKDGWNRLLAEYDDNDIISISDMSSYLGEDEICPVAVNTVAVLNCAIYDSGEYKGFVSFGDNAKKRSWTLEEVRTLKTISKIISSYLLKMRAFQKANRIVDRLTNFDKLTGLPRSNKFKETATQLVRGSSDKFALIYCDINNFKYINEKYGSDNGDRLLCSFAKKLPELPVPVCCSSRVFSDKFISLIRYENEDLRSIVLRFLNDFTASEKAHQPESNITVASGIYIVEDNDSFDINIAMDNVSIARKIAKERDETSCVLFEAQMKEKINRSIEIVSEAKHALINKEFVVYYQPKIGLKESNLVGAEALVRWRKPDGKIVPPGSFIPYLEKNGIIVNVDFYVYEEVCRFIRRRLDEKKPIVPISVNVSRIHLRDPAFLDKVLQIVRKYDIPSHLLEFELTESVFLENQSAAVNTMSEMKKHGFLVSIDDFGSGFSSLGLLKSLPVDILKIDKEFFANDTLQTNDQIMLSSIISMANRMNISVICEGVETLEQVQFLKETQCDMVQGFFYAKPISTEEFISFSEKHCK